MCLKSFYRSSFQVYLASNQAGQGQLLNSVPILTSVGQGQSNGAVNQRIVAVGGNKPTGERVPVKVEPAENRAQIKTESNWENNSDSTSASETDTDGNEEIVPQTLPNKPAQIAIKQEPREEIDGESFFME